MTDQDPVEMPEDKPNAPPIVPADLPEVKNVEIDTVSAPKE